MSISTAEEVQHKDKLVRGQQWVKALADDVLPPLRTRGSSQVIHDDVEWNVEQDDIRIDGG